ncbi:hypothetical protein KJ068_06500 [bacterium]|nr:hypothetical protein [bacterium]
MSVPLVSEQYAPGLSSTAFLFEELMIELRRQGVTASVRTLTPGYHGYAKEDKIAWRETRKDVPVRRRPRLPFNRSNRAGEALNREVEDISRRSSRSRDQQTHDFIFLVRSFLQGLFWSFPEPKEI